MKRSTLTAAIAALAVFTTSVSAYAQSIPPQSKELGPRNCSRGVEYVIDFKREKNDVPYYILDREIISWKCVTTGTTYQLVGMPGSYPSESEVIEAFRAFRHLKKQKITPDDLAAAYKYIDGLEAIGREKTAERK